MTQAHRDKIIELGKSYPTPSGNKFDKNVANLKRMAKFYGDKIPDVPDYQAGLFRSFVAALTYATNTLIMYKKLSTKLAELMREIEDEQKN